MKGPMTTATVSYADAALSVPSRTEKPSALSAAGAGLALLCKGLVIMEAISQAKRPPRLSEISTQTGIPISTTHRILAVLCNEGMIERDADGYLPGWRSAQVFDPGLAPHWQRLRDCALPSMASLHAAMGGSISLTAPNRQAVAVLLHLRTPGGNRSMPRNTDDSSLHQAIARKLFGAYRVEHDLAAPSGADTYGIDNERVRSVGYLHARAGQTADVLAVPVFDHLRQVIAALAVCGRWTGKGIEPALHRLRMASAQTTRSLRADTIALGMRDTHQSHGQ
jgi:DNA-binding IclR family transcriptional regulator